MNNMNYRNIIFRHNGSTGIKINRKLLFTVPKRGRTAEQFQHNEWLVHSSVSNKPGQLIERKRVNKNFSFNEKEQRTTDKIGEWGWEKGKVDAQLRREKLRFWINSIKVGKLLKVKLKALVYPHLHSSNQRPPINLKAAFGLQTTLRIVQKNRKVNSKTSRPSKLLSILAKRGERKAWVRERLVCSRNKKAKKLE